MKTLYKVLLAAMVGCGPLATDGPAGELSEEQDSDVSVVATPANVTPGGTVTVTWSGVRHATERDFLTLVPDGGNVLIGRDSTDAAASGSKTFTAPGSGTFTIKLYRTIFSGSPSIGRDTVIGTSNTVTVGGVVAPGTCKASGMIFAHGVNNSPPGVAADQRLEPSRLQNFFTWKWPGDIAPLPTFGTVYSAAGQLTTGDVRVIYNRNAGLDGANGRLDSTAADEMAAQILWYYRHNYQFLGIASHSNGVYTTHVGWRRAKALIDSDRHNTRNPGCGTMDIRFAHVQAAYSRTGGQGGAGLIDPRHDSAWMTDDDLSGQPYARVAKIQFYHNRDQRNAIDCSPSSLNRADSWSVGTTVGRVATWPWVQDNRTAPSACTPSTSRTTWSHNRAEFFGAFECSPHQELIMNHMGDFQWGTEEGQTHCHLTPDSHLIRSRTSACNLKYDCW